MTVRVNGEDCEVVAPVALTALVKRFGFPIEAVAVAVNGEVVPRRQLPERMVCEGDRIEVIRAVGGG